MHQLCFLPDEMKPDTKPQKPISLSAQLKGDYCELLVLTRLVKEGYAVAIPYGSQPGWDILVEKDNNFQKWQVKSGKIYISRHKKSDHQILKSCVAHRLHNGIHVAYDPHAFDFMIVVFPDTNEFFKIPMKDIHGKSYISLNSDRYKW